MDWLNDYANTSFTPSEDFISTGPQKSASAILSYTDISKRQSSNTHKALSFDPHKTYVHKKTQQD
jgi:hypothetical protein